MHRIDTATAQKDKFGAGKDGFTRGNPQTGTPATDLDDAYFDMLQEELVGVVESAGIELDKSKHDQLLTALNALFLQRTNPFGDIKNDGAAAIATALTNLGLGNLKYGAPMIGELVHWPRSEMPQEIWTDCGMEFIPYMGQSFDAVKYPLLAQLHPTSKLPADMRGYVPRGWDNERGIDIARVLMSSQEDAIRNIVGTWSPITGGYYENGFGGAVTKNTGTQYPQIASSTATVTTGLKFDASLSVPTASENRVRNVAWNMIVRAK
ncbi:integrase [Salmonella enterica subsp. enterica]|nr:integrase [Salmonella enterica subsp. enterica]EDT7019779.1 integrase [Salmonella enterica subsp. enterica]EEA8587375.1 integrase [Salmonella enterica subsp. enterica]EEC0353913.1 integrase [Salmonella enterica subsp. enterica]